MAEAAELLPALWEDLDLAGERLEAATTVGENVLILAGPGAGKTHLLVAHAVYLARTQQGNIVLLTFSRNAAKELTQRISERLQPGDRRCVTATTIHSYALRLLHTHGYRLGLGGETIEILESARDIDLLAQEVAAEAGEPIEDAIVRRLERLLRRRALSAEDRNGTTLVGRLVKRMRETGRLSWELCIDLAIELLRTEPEVRRSIHHHVRFTLVDEAQDCDHAQLCLLWELIGGSGGNHVMVAMDPDQSLYAFRDANPEEALRWARALDPKEFELTESFRCPPRVAELGRAILGRRSGPVPPEAAGETLFFYGSNRSAEASFIAGRVRERLDCGADANRIAVLARSNYLLEPTRQAFDDIGIPYRLRPAEDFTAAETSVVALLELLNDLEEGRPLGALSRRTLRDLLGIEKGALEVLEERSLHGELLEAEEIVSDPRWLRIVEEWRHFVHPSRLVDEIDKAFGFCLAPESVLTQAARKARSVSRLLAGLQKSRRPIGVPGHGVLLATFHGSKGLEFKSVFILGCEDGVVPHYRARTDDERMQERRALYVALTRTSREVVLTAVREDRGRLRKPSPFLPLEESGLWTHRQGL